MLAAFIPFADPPILMLIIAGAFNALKALCCICPACMPLWD